jgi:hypothetical protein
MEVNLRGFSFQNPFGIKLLEKRPFIPLPRKGTETRVDRQRSTARGGQQPQLSSHFPARGRKQCGRKLKRARVHTDFHPTSPQGDGNARWRSPLWSKRTPHGAFIPLPRKGTETVYGSGIKTVLKRTFIPLPRKGTETCSPSRRGWHFSSCSAFIPLPRKGTETPIPRLSQRRFMKLPFHPTSPQGDGNPLKAIREALELNLSSHFPARGRKLKDSLGNVYVHGTFIPLPRKGTETSAETNSTSVQSSLSSHFPARGRKPEKRLGTRAIH